MCYYPGFQSAIHGEKLRHELARDLTRETAWESVMRIRCGKGHPLHDNFYPIFALVHTCIHHAYTHASLDGCHIENDRPYSSMC